MTEDDFVSLYHMLSQVKRLSQDRFCVPVSWESMLAIIKDYQDYFLYQLDAKNFYSREFSVIFLSLSTFAAAVPFIPILQIISRHGKRNPLEAAQEYQKKTARASNATILSVPKSLFVHMYAVGIVIGAICFSMAAVFAETKMKGLTSNKYMSSVSFQGTLMFEVHCMRRLLECLYITAYGSSSMDVSAYLAGIFHYVFTPTCILCSLLYHDSQDFNNRNAALWIFPRLFSLLLYTIGSASQFRCHRILFNMKRSSKDLIKLDSINPKSTGDVKYFPLDNPEVSSGSVSKSRSGTVNNVPAPSDPPIVHHAIKSVYSFPVGFGFDSVACPHYTAEIIIYISFCMLSPFSFPLLCLLLWVVTNLSVVADSQFLWYHKKFPKELSLKKEWKRLIPGVW